MDKIRIIEAGHELGLGGTEYVIQLYSKFLNKCNFEVVVVAIREGGVRTKLIEDLGVRVIVLNGDLQKLGTLLKEADVLHWHDNGTENTAVFNVIRENKPKLVIQTNVFGQYDGSTHYDLVDYDMFVSRMILVRRMLQDENLKDRFISKRKALYNPVDVNHITSLIPSENQVQEFKRKNNLQDCFIVGRIGRAADAKFHTITLDGFAEFSKRTKNTRFLLVGATPHVLEYAQALGILDKMIILENTPDLEQLLIYYSCLDIFLAVSRIGESFGLAIAEAMSVGVPVVTASTPLKDNAQIELIDNGQTGLVVEREAIRIAEALLFLYQNKETRLRFSKAARLKAIKEFEAERIVKSLENLIYQNFNLPYRNDDASLIVDYSGEIANEYAARCSNLWEPG
jgi:glycosyltransferase involved in cell wall biosynthesis